MPMMDGGGKRYWPKLLPSISLWPNLQILRFIPSFCSSLQAPIVEEGKLRRRIDSIHVISLLTPIGCWGSSPVMLDGKLWHLWLYFGVCYAIVVSS
jgi:hypothetical protein